MPTRNPKSKPAAAAKPVRAWIVDHRWDEMHTDLRRHGETHLWLYRKGMSADRPVLILDPCTHRAVAIKKGRGK